MVQIGEDQHKGSSSRYGNKNFNFGYYTIL